MVSEVELLASWAVEVGPGETPSLLLVLNGRRVAVPWQTADLLAQALRERALEISKCGRHEQPANNH